MRYCFSGPDAPTLDEARAAALRMRTWPTSPTFTRVIILAGGPLFDDELRGLSILNVEADRARALEEADPAVRIGRFSVKVISWMVPSGAMHFSPTRFPRSVAEVAGT